MRFHKKDFTSNIIRAVFFAFLLSLFTVFGSTSSFSADFYTESDYVVSYTLSDIKARVVYQISETNLSDSHRILSRSINYPAEVTNVSATAEGSTLHTSSSYDGTYSSITINFNRMLFGAGTSIDWTLSFDIVNGVQKSGLIRYFFLTGFESDNQTQSYQVNVDVPSTFGSLNFVSARNYETSMHSGNTRYRFSSDSGGLSPVTMMFGEFQAYDFSYNYVVDPTASLEFAIPGDRYNQRIIFTSVEPAPAISIRDQDGNYIVKYTPDALAGAQEITISGTALVYASNSTALKATMATETPDLSTYLKSDEYWEAANSSISSSATALIAGLDTNAKKAEAIYTHVIDTLVYDKNVNLSTHERKGAAVSILSPEGSVCQEYTDLFIALARAAGVPAREVAGYAEDVRAEESDALTLHSWVEFWDETNGWTMADPTWGDSSGGDYFGKVGSDHFVMLTRGADSIDPSIVSSFSRTKTSETGIAIDASAIAPTITVGAELSAEQQNNLPSVRYTLENTGNVALLIESAEVTLNGTTYTSDPPSDTSTYVALPKTQIQGNISILAFTLPSSIKNDAEVKVVASTLFDPIVEKRVSIETNNYWLILPILLGLVGILLLVLLVRSVVKWIRK